jgi:hypothetical protein
MAVVIVKQGKLKKTRNRKPDFFIGCPLTHNRSSWCNQFCVPVKGRGPCGRIAAHALKGSTQRAIDEWKARQAAECCAE